MKQSEIKIWLNYWSHSTVNVDAIQSLEDVAIARRFCSVMRVGLFCYDLVSDEQIWDAIVAIREK